MRWEGLFADLEAQLAEADRAELMAEAPTAPGARSPGCGSSTGCVPPWIGRWSSR